eukprot:1301997-Rhodomonas_salina.2
MSVPSHATTATSWFRVVLTRERASSRSGPCASADVWVCRTCFARSGTSGTTSMRRQTSCSSCSATSPTASSATGPAASRICSWRSTRSSAIRASRTRRCSEDTSKCRSGPRYLSGTLRLSCGPGRLPR